MRSESIMWFTANVAQLQGSSGTYERMMRGVVRALEATLGEDKRDTHD